MWAKIGIGNFYRNMTFCGCSWKCEVFEIWSFSTCILYWNHIKNTCFYCDKKYWEEPLILPAKQLSEEKDLILQVNFLKFFSIIWYCFGMFLLRLEIIAIILIIIAKRPYIFFKHGDGKISKQMHFIRESKMKISVWQFLLLCNWGKMLLKVAIFSLI